MDEKKPASSWDDLLKEIGAAPPPDALERKRPAIETTFEPPPPAKMEAVKPKPGDWNALASELGIEAPAEPPRKPAPPAAERHDQRGPSSSALEASFAEIEPLESDFEEVVEAEISDIEFEGDDDFPTPSQRGLDDDTLSGEAARNAFESLFEAGSFSALPPLKKPAPRERDRAAGGPQWRDDDAPRPGGEHEEIEFEEVHELGEEAVEGEKSEEEQPGRPRRRRRRRGGRGRERTRGERSQERAAAPAGDEGDEWSDSVSEAAGEEEEDETAETVEGEVGEKPVRRRRRRRRRSKGDEAAEPRSTRAAANGQSGAVEEDEDEDEDEDYEESHEDADGQDEDDGDDSDESPRESHKNIPTWSEAISVMVETNLQSRKNAPSRPSGPRDRGRGRGRGRGGNGRRGKP